MRKFYTLKMYTARAFKEPQVTLLAQVEVSDASFKTAIAALKKNYAPPFFLDTWDELKWYKHAKQVKCYRAIPEGQPETGFEYYLGYGP